MDDQEPVIVDFVIPDDSEKPAPVPGLGIQLGRCSCGADNYVLASEMLQDAPKGIPASRMYECIGCGEYRLG